MATRKSIKPKAETCEVSPDEFERRETEAMSEIGKLYRRLREIDSAIPITWGDERSALRIERDAIAQKLEG